MIEKDDNDRGNTKTTLGIEKRVRTGAEHENATRGRRRFFYDTKCERAHKRIRMARASSAAGTGRRRGGGTGARAARVGFYFIIILRFFFRPFFSILVTVSLAPATGRFLFRPCPAPPCAPRRPMDERWAAPIGRGVRRRREGAGPTVRGAGPRARLRCRRRRSSVQRSTPATIVSRARVRRYSWKPYIIIITHIQYHHRRIALVIFGFFVSVRTVPYDSLVWRRTACFCFFFRFVRVFDSPETVSRRIRAPVTPPHRPAYASAFCRFRFWISFCIVLFRSFFFLFGRRTIGPVHVRRRTQPTKSHGSNAVTVTVYDPVETVTTVTAVWRSHAGPPRVSRTSVSPYTRAIRKYPNISLKSFWIMTTRNL